MKTIFTALMCITFLNSAIGQRIVGELTMNDGKKINLYEKEKKERIVVYDNVLTEDVNLTAQSVYYYDKSGKIQEIGQSKVKTMYYANKRYTLLPIYSMGMERLHEVIAESNEYLISSYYHKGFYLFIFKKADMEAVVKKERHSLKAKQDLAIVEKKIKPYFSNCKEFLELLKKSIEDSNYKREYSNGALIVKNNLFSGVSDYKCQ